MQMVYRKILRKYVTILLQLLRRPILRSCLSFNKLRQELRDGDAYRSNAKEVKTHAEVSLVLARSVGTVC